VREARRLVGVSTLSEHDVFVGPELGRTRLHTDSIAAGEYPLDSFPTRKREPGHDVVLEGYILMMDKLTHPYQIPYGIIVPKTVDGLLVPVAASTTHIAFASIRLEPTWMTLGQAAGAAAHLAISQNVAPRAVPIDALQRELLREGQVLTYFKDIDRADPAHTAIQYFGTKGFFPDYFAKSKGKLDRATAREWLRLVWPKSAPQVSSDAGDFTGVELKRALEAVGSRTPVKLPDGALTRGDFCRIVFEAQFGSR
jgi:FAD dependent oxidoreductase